MRSTFLKDKQGNLLGILTSAKHSFLTDGRNVETAIKNLEDTKYDASEISNASVAYAENATTATTAIKLGNWQVNLNPTEIGLKPIYAGTEDMENGVTELPSGYIYFVVEE